MRRRLIIGLLGLGSLFSCHPTPDPRSTGSMTSGRPGVSRGELFPDTSMVFIPGGTFTMGTDSTTLPSLQEHFGIRRRDVFSAEFPAHPVTVASFYMEKYEVTNAQFQAFLEAQPAWQPARIPRHLHNGDYLKDWQGRQYPPGQGQYPVVYTSWYAAMAYAQWVGKRLPTEAEWEYAARGGFVGQQFPWGDALPSPAQANYGASGFGRPTPVGQYPPNGYGLYDLAGNVWEYCVDAWEPYGGTPQVNPVGGGALYLDDTFRRVTTRRVIRGGSWGGAVVNLRVAYRDSHPPEGAGPHVGFRCVRPAEGATRGPRP